MKLDNKIFLLCCFAIVLIGCSTFELEPKEADITTYFTTMGGNGYSAALDAIEAEDAYLLAGVVGPQCDIVDAFLAKIDKESGVTLNMKTFGNSNQGIEENFFTVASIQGQYKAVGFANNKLPPETPEALFCKDSLGGSNGRIFLSSVDEDFGQSSSHYLGQDSMKSDFGFEIQEAPNGEVFLAGSWEGFIAVMQLEADTISKVISSSTYAGNGFKMLFHSSGRIFVTAEVFAPPTFLTNIYWAEVDRSSNSLINERIFTFENRGDWKKSLAYAVLETPDGNMILAGALTDNNNKEAILIMKMDLQGNELLFKSIRLGTNDSALDMIAHEDGYVLVGKVTIDGVTVGTDLLIAKIDQEGNFLWKEFHDLRGNEDWGHTIISTSDGGFLAGGRTINFTNGIQTILVLKTDAEGKID